MEHDEESYSWAQSWQQLRQSIAALTCSEIVGFLEANWEKLPVSTRDLYVSELVSKQCQQDQAMPYVLQMLRSEDSFYRFEALEFIKDLGGREYKKTFIEVARHDDAEDVVQAALMCLTDLFRGEKDRAVLSLAYAIYEDQQASMQLKLAAAATMMYQLGIPHDEQGRPAWWDEEEETIDHPSLQRAVAETRNVLRTSGGEG